MGTRRTWPAAGLHWDGRELLRKAARNGFRGCIHSTIFNPPPLSLSLPSLNQHTQASKLGRAEALVDGADRLGESTGAADAGGDRRAGKLQMKKVDKRREVVRERKGRGEGRLIRVAWRKQCRSCSHHSQLEASLQVVVISRVVGGYGEEGVTR